jgi:hypothetical protein
MTTSIEFWCRLYSISWTSSWFSVGWGPDLSAHCLLQWGGEYHQDPLLGQGQPLHCGHWGQVGELVLFVAWECVDGSCPFVTGSESEFKRVKPPILRTYLQ